MSKEKKNVNIWKTLQKVPAGTMFVPLIIGAIITTVCQGIFHFDLWETIGNPMKDMFSSTGQMLLIGLMLFCTGTSLKLGDLKDALHRGSPTHHCKAGGRISPLCSVLSCCSLRRDFRNIVLSICLCSYKRKCCALYGNYSTFWR